MDVLQHNNFFDEYTSFAPHYMDEGDETISQDWKCDSHYMSSQAAVDVRATSDSPTPSSLVDTLLRTPSTVSTSFLELNDNSKPDQDERRDEHPFDHSDVSVWLPGLTAERFDRGQQALETNWLGLTLAMEQQTVDPQAIYPQAGIDTCQRITMPLPPRPYSTPCPTRLSSPLPNPRDDSAGEFRRKKVEEPSDGDEGSKNNKRCSRELALLVGNTRTRGSYPSVLQAAAAGREKSVDMLDDSELVRQGYSSTHWDDLRQKHDRQERSPAHSERNEPDRAFMESSLLPSQLQKRIAYSSSDGTHCSSDATYSSPSSSSGSSTASSVRQGSKANNGRKRSKHCSQANESSTNSHTQSVGQYSSDNNRTQDDTLTDGNATQCATKRVIKACYNCHLRKMKCSGDDPPCSACRKRGLPCVFPHEVRRRGKAKCPGRRNSTAGSPPRPSMSRRPAKGRKLK